MNRGRRVPLSLALTELRSNDPNSHDIFPGARRLVEVREHDDLVLAPPAFVPQEVAYRRSSVHAVGKKWSRKVLKTEAAFDKFIARLQADDFEIEVRNAEVSR